MLLEFCVKNFLSLKDEAKLSFIASTLKESLQEENDLINELAIGLSACEVLSFMEPTLQESQTC